MVDNYYNEIATGYNRLHKVEQLKKIRIIIKNLNLLKEKYSISNKPILDVGCGTGFSLDIFSEEFQKECVGIDPSNKLLEQYQGNQKTYLLRAEDLLFEDNSFSMIISVTAIQNFDDLVTSLDQIKRVLENGGLLAISCLKKSENLKEIAENLAEFFMILNVVEEEKDIIFFCKK